MNLYTQINDKLIVLQRHNTRDFSIAIDELKYLLPDVNIPVTISNDTPIKGYKGCMLTDTIQSFIDSVIDEVKPKVIQTRKPAEEAILHQFLEEAAKQELPIRYVPVNTTIEIANVTTSESRHNFEIDIRDGV